jgi:WD40 repeat protein
VKKATDAIPAAEKTITEKKAALRKDHRRQTQALCRRRREIRRVRKESKAESALEAAKLAAKQAEQSVADAKTASEKAAALLQKAEAEIAPAKKALADSEKSVRAVAFAPNGLTIATAGDDQIVHTWSADRTARASTLSPASSAPCQALAYTADGRLISGSAKNGAVVWRSGPNWTLARTIGTGDEKSPLAGRVLALDFSADGKLLATGGGVASRSGELKIWRTADSTLAREILPSHSDTVFGLAFSPDGKFLASASADKFVKVFDVTTGKLFKQLAGHTHYVFGVSWRADGRTLASCGADKVVKLWSFPGGEQFKTIEGFGKEVTSVRFIGIGGEMLATSGDTKVRTLKEDGSAQRDFAGGKGFIFSAAITPDGQTILGGGQDSVLRAWNATSGKSLLNLEPPPGEIPAKAAKPAAK